MGERTALKETRGARMRGWNVEEAGLKSKTALFSETFKDVLNCDAPKASKEIVHCWEVDIP